MRAGRFAARYEPRNRPHYSACALTSGRWVGYNIGMKNIVSFVVALVAAVASGASLMDNANLKWTYQVVVSKAADADPAWRKVADELHKKYAKTPLASRIAVANPTEAAPLLREVPLGFDKPDFVAFVMKPEEATERTVYALHAMMKSLDDDPYYDAVWGIVTGPTPEAALRVATAKPIHPRSALSTTGVNFAPFTDATTLSDGYAPGFKREDYALPNKPVAVYEKRDGKESAMRIVRGDSTSVFASAWDELDPELVVTSSHASQRNLEMPFSTGNIVPRNGELWSLPDKKLIDYTTGQADASASAQAAASKLAAPKRDKVWIAAGNCLIGDYKDANSMAAAMIGYGRVVQFMGYVKTTWFGEIGWETLAQFFERGATAAEAWYFAGQNLERKLSLMDKRYRTQNLVGRIWDRNATILWGDPALDASLEESQAPRKARLTGKRTRAGVVLTFTALEDMEAKEDKVEEVHVVHPFGIILTRRPKAYEVKGDTKGLGVFAADDFALITSWPAMKKGESIQIRLRSPGGR